MSGRILVLLDTDIGSDIDDAVCLAYLLAQPRCELVGVTTVSGEAQERAMLVDAICRAAGRTDVPIHAGAEHCLIVPQRQPEAPQAVALERWEHRDDFAPNTAVAFLRDAITARPGEITLLTIGPLTNAALLFATYPETARMLKALVMMAGTWSTAAASGRRAEWNVLVDPHAAAIAYGAPVPLLTSVGLDVTMQCTMPADECRKRLTGGPLDVVADMAEVWFKSVDRICFHDPLAGAVVFKPELCTYEEGRVDVDLKSDHAPGMTFLDRNAEEKPHRVAMGVDADAFFEHYFQIVKG
jgi:inosine-uridine nucleoside N-ribohydrolase